MGENFDKRKVSMSIYDDLWGKRLLGLFDLGDITPIKIKDDYILKKWQVMRKIDSELPVVIENHDFLIRKINALMDGKMQEPEDIIGYLFLKNLSLLEAVLNDDDEMKYMERKDIDKLTLVLKECKSAICKYDEQEVINIMESMFLIDFSILAVNDVVVYRAMRLSLEFTALNLSKFKNNDSLLASMINMCPQIFIHEFSKTKEHICNNVQLLDALFSKELCEFLVINHGREEFFNALSEAQNSDHEELRESANKAVRFIYEWLCSDAKSGGSVPAYTWNNVFAEAKKFMEKQQLKDCQNFSIPEENLGAQNHPYIFVYIHWTGRNRQVPIKTQMDRIRHGFWAY